MRTIISALGLGALLLAFGVFAQERRGNEREQPRRAPVRQAPGQFQAHPPGAHPHGAIVRAHPVRVLRPRVVERGHEQWRRWDHPEFARPTYYWDWNQVHTVTCVAEDSYGDQYPVSQAAWAGFALNDMTSVEDQALDRCFNESGGDQSCYLATCSHF